MARRLSIAHPTLSKYEKGHRVPDAELLRKMVVELRCDPGWLLTGQMTSEDAVLPLSGEKVIYMDKKSPLFALFKRLESIYHENDQRKLDVLKEIIKVLGPSFGKTKGSRK